VHLFLITFFIFIYWTGGGWVELVILSFKLTGRTKSMKSANLPEPVF